MTAETQDQLIAEIDSVNKTYPNGIRALVVFSMKVRPGDVLVIIRPSGSGKSTLLRNRGTFFYGSQGKPHPLFLNQIL